MGRLHLSRVKGSLVHESSLRLPPSKSIEARKLLLAAIQGRPLGVVGYKLDELPEDLQYLIGALDRSVHVGRDQGSTEVHAGESGTAMRFLTAFLASTTEVPVLLTGSGRQYERPIAPLVDALRELGADIRYTLREGYPPLEIHPAHLAAKSITLDASRSSQYLSALLLIAPLIGGGRYQIDTSAHSIISAPYINITIDMMRDAGYYWQQRAGVYSYLNESSGRCACQVYSEADWTAASYAYLLVLLMSIDSPHVDVRIYLNYLTKPSTQGDSDALPKVMYALGVLTECSRQSTTLSVGRFVPIELFECSGADCPDIVPTLVAGLIARRQAFHIDEVGHLRIKESDRLASLQEECYKLGVKLSIDESSIAWDGTIDPLYVAPDTAIELNPHRDHRIAMALAPLMAHLHPHGVIVVDAEVVEKSYPSYWEELQSLGYGQIYLE